MSTKEQKTTNQLAIVQDNLKKLFQTRASAIPKTVNKTKFIQNCIFALASIKKDIDQMDPMSVAFTMIRGAFLGLDFANKECYAIPYKDKESGKYFLNFQTDYKGEVKLAKMYSVRPVKEIYAEVVREGDDFDLSIEHGQPSIRFHPKRFNDANIEGAFAVCEFQDGGMLYEVMTWKQIQNVRYKFSKFPSSKMWNFTPEEACKKTVIRRLRKHITLEFENQDQIESDEIGSGMSFEDAEDITPIQMPEAVSSENGEKETTSDIETKLANLNLLAEKHADKLKGKLKTDFEEWQKKKDPDKVDFWIEQLNQFEKEPTML